MKHSIGLIAPQEPDTLALLSQQRITWQQARRQAVRLLLAGRDAGAIVADLRVRFGLWPTMAIRLVRQAQNLLHPGSSARAQYLAYLADGGDGATTLDELAFYQELPDAGNLALTSVDYQAPAWLAEDQDGLDLVYVPDLKAFYLSLPIAGTDGDLQRIEGLPVHFADGEAAELQSLTRGGNASGRPVVVPSQELIWWQGTPHLVVGFDPDDCVTGYEAIRQPAGRGLKTTAAVAATLAMQSALPVIGVAMAAETPQTYQVAIAQTPIVKVLDSATGRQLIGVRLVAEDGKVLARSDDSGTLVLPNGYSRYNLFNLVKEGYQFMLLESTQLTPHNLLRVEMSPVAAKGKATARTAAITPPPALPNSSRPKTLTTTAQAATPKPPAVKPVQVAVRPSQAVVKPQTAKATVAPVKPQLAKATVAPVKPQVAKATVAPVKPQVAKATVAPVKPQTTKVAVATVTPQTTKVAVAPAKPQTTKAVVPPVKPQTTKAVVPPVKPQTAKVAVAPAKPQQQAAKTPLPATPKPARMAQPMAEIAQTPRTPAPASTYRVKRGDTLWTIAQSQLGAGHRWIAIYTQNKGTVSHPSRIQVGQVLQLPQRQTLAAAATKVRITVRPGDSLSLIAQKRLGRTERWREIFELNRQTLRNPRLVFPGQALWIPAR
jgi:nucleoid-associated protein YgaU